MSGWANRDRLIGCGDGEVILPCSEGEVCAAEMG